MSIQISKLVIRNFKSFLNDHTILLSNATSFMGGPKSGKTNLIDAINFVTGEQDLLKLRVTTLQDLIHRGVDEKDETCFVEATLVLENDSHIFRRSINSNRSVYEIDGDEVSKEEYLNQLNLVSIDVVTRNFILSHNTLKSLEWRTPKAIARKIEEFRSKDVVNKYDLLNNELSNAQETVLDHTATQNRLRAEIKRIKERLKNSEIYTSLKTALEKYRLNLSLLNLYHSEEDIKRLVMEQERITTDIPGITEQRENIGKDLEKSFEDRQIWEKNCKASELGQITAENNKNNCMLRAVESKFEVTKHRKDIIESTINSLNRKLMSLKDKMGNFHANIRELEHEKLAPANLQLPEYSNELDEEYDQLELGADGSLELFLLEQQQKDDQKTRSELEKSLDFSNHQKNKEDVRRLKKDQAIEAQLSKLHRKHEKRAEMLVELEEAQSRRIAVNDELKDIDLQLMKSKLAHLEKDETRVVELLSNEFGEVYGRLKDLCHCSDPDYEVTFKLAIKKYSEAILVDSSATALKCIQYLKDNCIPSEIFLPLKENELKEKNSSLEVLPNLQRQGIKLVKDVLVCDFPGIDVSKAVMYAAQKTLLCTDSATAAKASYNMSTRRNTSVDPTGILNHRSGIITKLNITTVFKATDALEVDQTSELESRELNLQQERLHCEDVEKIQAQLLRLGAEIGHINRGLQNLQEDLTEVAQDYYGASIQQNKDELNRIGELDPEILQNIQDLKNQEASEENSYFQAFCGKSGAQNIQEYRRLRFWQNDPEIFDDGINIYLDRIETLNQKCSSYENDLEALNVKKSAFHQNFEELSVEEKKLRAVLEISKVDFLVIQAEFGLDQDKQQETKKREISLTNQLQQLKDDEIHLKKNRERIKIKIDALNRSRYDVVLQSWKDQVPIRLTIGNYNNLFLPPTNTEDEDESNLLHQHRISKIAVCYNRLSEAQKNFTLEQRKQNEKNILTKIQNSEVRLKFRIKPNPEVFEILQDKAEQLNANLASKKQDLKTICERVQNTKQEFENVRQQRIQQFGEDVEAASEAIQAFFGIISRQDEHIQFIPDNSAEPYLRGVEVNMDLSIRPAGLLALHFTLNKTPIVVMDEVEAGLNKDDATRLFEWLTANRDDTQSQIVLTTKRGSVDHGQIYGIWTENGNSMVHLHSAN